jgi:hypothetical protein
VTASIYVCQPDQNAAQLAGIFDRRCKLPRIGSPQRTRDEAHRSSVSNFSIRPMRLVLTDAFAEPATHCGIVSFAEHPRNQPFFLGLQSLLELLLYKIGIPRVSHRVYKIDAVSQQQLD